MSENKTMDAKTFLTGSNLHSDSSEVVRLQHKLNDVIKEANQFTYIVTHDLQAPLRMVTGFLDLLERKYNDQLDAGARQYIGYAVKGSMKMKDLIFDLLEYSRLSSVVHTFETVKLDEVLQSAMEKLKDSIEQTGAEITSENLPALYGSKKMLEQLFVHILGNSIKFKSDQTPRIHIQSGNEDGCCKIDVTDNGIGIDPSFFERIFIIFKKLHPEEAGYGGTGTGLAVCKKIAELHQGTIEVISAPGQGSTFRVSIPHV
jgi:light-regulated signal transduction histidine kinase (bacteriophytochrome)